MTAAYRFRSVPTDVANLLRTALAAAPRTFTEGVTVGTVRPAGRSEIDAQLPLVVVAQDGPGDVRSRIHQVAQVRLIAWHRTADLTDDLIQHAHALATGLGGGGTPVRSVTTRLAPWVDTDPDTGTPIGAATCTVHTIAQAITE